MHGHLNPPVSEHATRRYRGTIFAALHGPDDHIRGVTVAADFAMACLALADAREGEIWVIPPDEGAPLRRFLAGGPPPLRCPMRRCPDNLISEVAREAEVSRRTALRAVESFLEAQDGVGAALYAGAGQNAQIDRAAE